jgi:hypothetical protein
VAFDASSSAQNKASNAFKSSAIPSTHFNGIPDPISRQSSPSSLYPQDEPALRPYDKRPDLVLAIPKLQQPPLRTTIQRNSYFISLVWIVFAILIIWISIMAAFGMRRETCTATWVSDQSAAHYGRFSAFFSYFCQLQIRLYINPILDRRDWLGPIIQSLILSIFTLGLHCVEVLTQLIRDEAIWRKLATTGARPDRGAVLAGAATWQCWVLFAFKCVVPWMFRYAFQADAWVFMNLVPLVFLAGLFVLLGSFAEVMRRHKPKGS